MSSASTNYIVERITETNYVKFSQLLAYRLTGQYNATFSNKVDNKQKVSDILNSQLLYVFASKLEDKYVGYISASIIPKPDARLGTMFVDELWVAPQFRQQGMARKLMQAVEQEARHLGLWRLRLYVSKDNVVGRTFYENFGLIEKGEAIFCEKDL